MRYIRIKEFGANNRLIKTPEAAYLAMSNSSLMKDTFFVATDGNGFIFDPDCQDGSDAPVFVFGDSFVESIFVQQGERFCDRLTRRMSAAGTPRQFLNGGYSGATSLILLNTLINRVGFRKNTTVILVLPSNDTLASGFKRGFWDYSSKRYSPVLPVDGGDSTTCRPEENRIQLEAILRIFSSTANLLQLELIFATTPFVHSDYEDQPWFKARYSQAPARYGRLIDGRRRSNEVMRSVARDMDVAFLDLETLFSNAEHFYDDLHLNVAGSSALADLIYCHLGEEIVRNRP